jgi:pimeloyl-ACP methyl ester carboxylesterase
MSATPGPSAKTRVETGFMEGLAYRRYGSGEHRDWVLLIPGAGAAGAIWRRQIPVLSSQYNLLVVDLPGHGRSLRGKERERYAFEQIAETLLAILNHERIRRAHLVAMSLGGLVAEAFALHYPERVVSLTLASGIARLDLLTASAMFLGWLLAAVTPYMVLYRVFAWLIMPGRRHAQTRRVFARHATRLGRDEFLRWFQMCPDALPLFRRFGLRQAQIPTLFLMGDKDLFFLRRAFERSRLRRDTVVAVIPACGHVCSIERPREFNRILCKFLASQCREIPTAPAASGPSACLEAAGGR